MTANIAGLISGNFKRHLQGRHGLGQLVFDLFGDRLTEMAQPRCRLCEEHVEALAVELERLASERAA